MKKLFLPALSVAVLAIAATTLHAGTNQAAKKELITGEIVCAHCYASEANMGDNPNGCKTRCIVQKGMPAVILQEGTGTAYVIVWKGGESAAPKVAPLIGKKINIQGPVFKKDGINVIEGEIIAEAM